ncbi:hypothetical protein [Streptomyces sp. NPDC057616]|uniref:hypothetical protein n=1 Tax=Streptomyces sp. NPDC057616 TaxID=3346183 RepID=UPI0036B7BEA6
MRHPRPGATGPAAGGLVAAPWRPFRQLSKPSAWPPGPEHRRGHDRPHAHRRLDRDRGPARVGRHRQDGTRAPAGTCTWTLTARPADAQGADLPLTGTTTVN